MIRQKTQSGASNTRKILRLRRPRRGSLLACASDARTTLDGFPSQRDPMAAPVRRRGWSSVTLRCVSRKPVFAVSTVACVVSLTSCGSSGTGGSAPDLTKFKDSRQPYYYVGLSFDGLRLTHAESYDAAGVAFLAYGTCKPPPDGGCPAPLELQHRLCRERVTVVIFTGANPKPGRAARAAHALQPLSKGARGVTPELAFDRSPPC